jgi:hypothetical protein
MFEFQKITHICLALFFAGLSQIAIAQKVTLESGNLVAVDGEAICQFATDSYSIYLFNLNQKGVDIFNSRGETYKAVKTTLRVYFSDLTVKVINKGDVWPKHLNEVPNGMQEGSNAVEVNSSVGVVVKQDELSGLKPKLKFSGGMILLGESIKLIGGVMVEENPTLDAINTYKTLDRIGSLLIILGAGALIVN